MVSGKVVVIMTSLDALLDPLRRAMEEFDTSGDGAHANWSNRFFAKIVDSLLVKTENNGGLVGNAMTHILSARELLDFALPLMEAVAADQLTLREKDDRLR